MGKGAIYVFLLLIAIGAVAGLIWLGYHIGEWLLERAHVRHVAHLKDSTPWRQYLDVGDLGEYIIGVERAAEGHTFARVELTRLEATAEALDVKLKINEAKDRAIIYNNERETSTP